MSADAWRLLVACGVLLSAVAAWGQDSRPTSQPVGENLLFNGNFETVTDAARLPAGWTSKHPENVRLVDLGGERGRVIEMTGGRKLMASYGIDLTGAKIPIEPNTRYRCTGLTKSAGPNIKVFIKGYATVTRRVAGEMKTFDDIVYQMRKDIEPSDDWEPFNLDFAITPAAVFSDFQHEITYVRVRLWAFHPAGTCWFDDLRFEKVGPVPESEWRHAAGMTHVGLPPRLSEAARKGDDRPADAFDEENTWREAANAFKREEHARAAHLAETLIAHAPAKGMYRVLAIRALAALKRWEETEPHTRWLLEEKPPKSGEEEQVREIESWQLDWARVVRAQALWRAGHGTAAREQLERVLSSPDGSPHARAAAERLLAVIPGSGSEE